MSANSITLIIDYKEHAVQLAQLLKQNNVEYGLFQPAGETSSYKFKFQDPGDFIKGEINTLIDSWNEPER